MLAWKIVIAMASTSSVPSNLDGRVLLWPSPEVLATQHYQTLSKWIPQLEVNVDLLTGSTAKSRRKQILTDLANGSTKILVGTHASFEDTSRL